MYRILSQTNVVPDCNDQRQLVNDNLLSRANDKDKSLLARESALNEPSCLVMIVELTATGLDCRKHPSMCSRVEVQPQVLFCLHQLLNQQKLWKMWIKQNKHFVIFLLCHAKNTYCPIFHMKTQYCVSYRQVHCMKNPFKKIKNLNIIYLVSKI